jgi:hypothetical protein
MVSRANILRLAKRGRNNPPDSRLRFPTRLRMPFLIERNSCHPYFWKPESKQFMQFSVGYGDSEHLDEAGNQFHSAGGGVSCLAM